MILDNRDLSSEILGQWSQKKFNHFILENDFSEVITSSHYVTQSAVKFIKWLTLLHAINSKLVMSLWSFDPFRYPNEQHREGPTPL